MLFFDEIPEAPSDPIFGLTEEFKHDPRKDKLYLSLGVYRDEQLQPVIMRAVKEAESKLLKTEKDKEYLPISGDERYLDGLAKITFGESSWEHLRSRVAGVQTVGGTGALRLGADLLKAYIAHQVVISDPTWPNHRGVFSRAGFVVTTYPYYDFKQGTIRFEELIHELERLKSKTVVLFQVTCHNPTGVDLSFDQWKQVADITKARGIIPFFDCAYQGFGKGLDEDLLPLHFFIETQQEFLLAYSCSKNFSLYCERVGALFVVLSSEEEKQRVQSVLKALIRNNVSNAPAHGAKIVGEILSDTGLTRLWKEELDQMRKRIVTMRAELAKSISQPRIADTNGLFCYLHLSPQEVECLKKEKAIYMTTDSRITLAALNPPAIERLFNALC